MVQCSMMLVLVGQFSSAVELCDMCIVCMEHEASSSSELVLVNADTQLSLPSEVNCSSYETDVSCGLASVVLECGDEMTVSSVSREVS